jgi:hypothetical protein
VVCFPTLTFLIFFFLFLCGKRGLLCNLWSGGGSRRCSFWCSRWLYL